MLNQFFCDWNTAIQSRTIVNETRNSAGVITMQETKFKFRDVEITMFSRIIPSSINLPPEKRRWTSEMFVPSTNKIIPSVRYNSRARCAAEIMAALIPGRAHEDIVEARNQARRAKFIEELNNKRKARLTETSFTPEDQEFIMTWINEHTIPGKFSWNDTIIEVLCKYHSYITGNGLLDNKISFNEAEKNVHINRMYNTACNLIKDSVTDKSGLPALKRASISYFFLAPKEVAYSIYIIRSAYSKIYDECRLSTEFMHIINLIAAYYARLTGTTIEARIAELKAQKEKKKEREYERNVNGTGKRFFTKNNNHHPKTSAYSDRIAPIGITVGDVFGDVLDNAVEGKEQKKSHKGKGKHKVAPVTDGQINGKQLEESLKEEQTAPVTETTIEQQQMEFARQMEEVALKNNPLVEGITVTPTDQMVSPVAEADLPEAPAPEEE